MSSAKSVNGHHNGARANGWFDQLAKGIAWVVGRPTTFFLSIGLIIVWALTGPFFDFNDTWQLVINTGTTIITAAIHLKLDELIRAIEGARNSAIDLEDKSEEELMEARSEYVKLAERAKEELDEHGVRVPLAPECDEAASPKPR